MILSASSASYLIGKRTLNGLLFPFRSYRMIQMPMIRSRILILSIVFLFGSEELWSQSSRYPEGYIVSNTGDTTFGFVRSGDDFKDQQQIIFYDEFVVKSKYTPERISAFGYNERHFESKPRPYLYSGFLADTVMFLQKLSDGHAKLYRFYTRRSIFTLQKGPAYFDMLEKPDGSLFEVSYNFKWKRIADALEDYPELSQAIRNDLFGPDDLPEILAAYNDWYDEVRQGMRP